MPAAGAAGTLLRARHAATLASGQPPSTLPGVADQYSYADGQVIVGTHTGDVTTTRKGRNVRDGRTKVSLIVDDLNSVDPWEPRGVRMHGEAETAELDGHFGPGVYLLIRPTLTWSWGLAGSVFQGGMKRTEWR